MLNSIVLKECFKPSTYKTSMTTVSGSPKRANIVLSSSIIAPDMAVGVQKASIHLEWASIRTRFRRSSTLLQTAEMLAL